MMGQIKFFGPLAIRFSMFPESQSFPCGIEVYTVSESIMDEFQGIEPALVPILGCCPALIGICLT